MNEINQTAAADMFPSDLDRRTADLMRRLGIPEEIIDPAGPNGADVLFRHVREAVKNREDGCWRALPEEIWMATMGCFPRFVGEHVRSYGYPGFDRGFWTSRQVEARLFRIGELEYELLEKDGRPFCVSIHIPSDARLEPELLNRSVADCRAFLADRFPAWSGLPFRCESWLLSPLLREWLPETARIPGFQRAFDIDRVFPDDDAAVEWVFHVAGGQRDAFRLEEAPEDTLLQRRMKAHMLSGGCPGAAEGVLARPFD